MFTLFSPSVLRPLRLLHLTGFLSYSKLLKNERSPNNDFKSLLGVELGASRTEGRNLDQLSLALALLVDVLNSFTDANHRLSRENNQWFIFFKLVDFGGWGCGATICKCVTHSLRCRHLRNYNENAGCQNQKWCVCVCVCTWLDLSNNCIVNLGYPLSTISLREA